MRSNPDADPEMQEIERLLRTATYYERLGCANVASALRALAQAKTQRVDECRGLAPMIAAS